MMLKGSGVANEDLFQNRIENLPHSTYLRELCSSRERLISMITIVIAMIIYRGWCKNLTVPLSVYSLGFNSD